MTLAYLMETVVWSVCLLAPIATFLALPKLMPLGRALDWSRVNLMRPLAWIASSSDERRTLGKRLFESWLRDVRAANPEGTPRGDVVRDGRLLTRARAVGWIAGGLVLGVTAIGTFGAPAIDYRYSLRIAVTIAATGVTMAWLARYAATGGAVWAQALALGKGGLSRLAIGFFVGTGYGAVAGFVTGVGIWVVVAALSLITWEVPASHDMMVGLTMAGVFSSVIGAFIGSALLCPVAAAARRSR